MKTVNDLVRSSAVAALVGSTLLVAADLPLLLSGPAEAQPPTSIIPLAHSLLCMLGTPLLALALPGLYLHQAERSGRLGLVAFFVALLGTILMVSSDWFEFFAGPPLARLVPDIEQNLPPQIIVGFIISFVTELLGWLLFGVGTYRARVFPRAAAIMLIVGVLLVPVGPVWITMVWNAAVGWLGFTILRSTPRVGPQLALEAA